MARNLSSEPFFYFWLVRYFLPGHLSFHVLIYPFVFTVVRTVVETDTELTVPVFYPRPPAYIGIAEWCGNYPALLEDVRHQVSEVFSPVERHRRQLIPWQSPAPH